MVDLTGRRARVPRASRGKADRRPPTGLPRSSRARPQSSAGAEDESDGQRGAGGVGQLRHGGWTCLGRSVGSRARVTQRCGICSRRPIDERHILPANSHGLGGCASERRGSETVARCYSPRGSSACPGLLSRPRATGGVRRGCSRTVRSPAGIAVRRSSSRPGEQTFFPARGSCNDPQRCPAAEPLPSAPGRSVVRANTTPRSAAMCGGQAMVPFAPRNDRPVYCSGCFDKVRAGLAASRPRPRRTVGAERRRQPGGRWGPPGRRHHVDRRPSGWLSNSRRPISGDRLGAAPDRNRRAHGRDHHPRDGRDEPAIVERRRTAGRRDGIQDGPQHPDDRGGEVERRGSRMARSWSTRSSSRSASSTRAEGPQLIGG